MITVRDMLLKGTQQLEKLEASRLESEVLLAKAMGVSRTYLFAHPEEALSNHARDRFMNMLKKRSDGEPVSYITGEKEFWSLRLSVSPAVLIPRPETELLVEVALDRIPKDAAWKIADIGTGSGAIALAIAHERPSCMVHASDISTDALEVAKSNAKQLGLDRISFHHGSWLEPLSGNFDLIASNPPYVASGDDHLQRGDLRFEPLNALVSGPDGLEAIREICHSAKAHLSPGGWLVLEHGHDQASACEKILESAGFEFVETFRDLEGTNRVVAGRQVE